jgi:hypothetical protein
LPSKEEALSSNSSTAKKKKKREREKRKGKKENKTNNKNLLHYDVAGGQAYGNDKCFIFYVQRDKIMCLACK